MDDIQRAVAGAVDKILTKKLNTLKRTYYIDGVVVEKNAGRYSVKAMGQTYINIPARTGMSFDIGDQVQMVIKNGVTSRKFIDDYKLI